MNQPLPANRLETNLAALRSINPAAASEIEHTASWRETLEVNRLEFICDVYENPADDTRLPVHDHQNPQLEHRALGRAIANELNRAWLVVVPGFGFGYAIRLALRELEQHRPGVANGILVVEPRPQLLRAAFEHEDFSEILDHPRALFAFGTNALQQALSLVEEQGFYVFSNQRISFKPGCGIGSLDQAGFTTTLRKRILQTHAELKSDFSGHFHQAQNKYSGNQFKKTSNTPRAVWAHSVKDSYAGNVTPHITRWYMNAFAQCGWQSDLLEVERSNFSLLYHATRHFHRSLPDLILSVNSSSSRIARFAQEYNLPRAVLLVDHPALQPYAKPYHPEDIIFTMSDKFLSPQARAQQRFTHIFGGAHPDVPRGRVAEQHTCPVSYVGSLPDIGMFETDLPPVLVDYISKISDALLADELSGYDLYEKLPPPGGDEKIQDVFHRYPNLRYHVRSLDLPKERIQPWFLLFSGYLFANYRKRSQTITRLLDLGCRVYGQKSWLNVLKPLGKERLYGGPVYTQQELADICASSQINLCVNSAQPGAFVNFRMFSVPLMGGFVLTDYIHLLDDVFQNGRNTAWYQHDEELDFPDIPSLTG